MILDATVVELAKATAGVKCLPVDDLVLLRHAERLNAADRVRIQGTSYQPDGINYIPEGFWAGVYERTGELLGAG